MPRTFGPRQLNINTIRGFICFIINKSVLLRNKNRRIFYMDLKTIIIISRSGAGKGTQARKLVEYFKSNDSREVFHLETGSRIRDFLQESTHASKIASEVVENGGLLPSFIAIWAWGGELIKKLDNAKHLIIDGAPRKVKEVDYIEEAFNFFGRQKVDVIYLNVGEDWSKTRLKERGRSDDKTDEDIARKMQWFNNEVLPAVNYYKDNDKYNFIEINGEQDIDSVHQEILSKLEI